jgi:hypothetical protein
MSKRIIILGAGRFGTHLASRLSEYGCDVAIADHDSDRVKELAEDGFHSFEADVEDEDALKELGVRDADAVVVSIGENMQGSVLATMALKELKVKKIIARALDAKHGKVLEKVGADLVVLPSRDMAYRLADRLRNDAGSDRPHPHRSGPPRQDPGRTGPPRTLPHQRGAGDPPRTQAHDAATRSRSRPHHGLERSLHRGRPKGEH